MTGYTAVYNMCTQIPSHAKELYQRCTAMLQEHVADAVLPALQHAAVAGPEELLQQAAIQRGKFMDYMRWIKHIFRCLSLSLSRARARVRLSRAVSWVSWVSTSCS